MNENEIRTRLIENGVKSLTDEEIDYWILFWTREIWLNSGGAAVHLIPILIADQQRRASEASYAVLKKVAVWTLAVSAGAFVVTIIQLILAA